MIKKIATIKNLAVFNDFDWDSIVRDRNNRPVHFKPLNIIYGRNYSGKTTLSRILCALETGKLSDKYTNSAFTVEFTDGTTVNQTSPKAHPYTVRVFNEDFVRSHLRVFFDDEHGIAPFAVLGDDNAELAEKLEAKEAELGPEEMPGSLLAREAERRTDWFTAQRDHKDAIEALEKQLRDKANAPGHGIKHNKLYGDANYDIRKIKDDIKTVRGKGYTPLAEAKADELKALLNETPKPEIPECTPLSLEYEAIVEEARSLVQRRITVSEPIQELLDDALLQEWVRAGREHHENKRETCGFCGNRLPDNLWSKLDKHFNQESETLREEIASLMAQIDTEIERASSLMHVDVNAFYSAYVPQAKSLTSKIQTSIDAYKATLTDVRKALEKRHKDIFRASDILDVQDMSPTLETLRNEYERLRGESNDYTVSLNKKQTEARTLLRRHDVAAFVSTIRYEEQQSKIDALKKEVDSKKERLKEATADVSAARQTIADLKAQMKDEINGAEKVNHYLSHYFGHPALSLQALANDDGEKKQYRFEIYRDGSRAYHLSEGERGLIAFCYFIARLEDVETSGKKPIIWIDDPVSSFDDNHVFFIHSLINNYIAQPGAFGQLFISTHSLAFLKYLKRLPKAKEVERAYFIVHRTGSTSAIQLMPKHLKEYATEFHYLFHQIYRCALADDASDPDVDVYYNLGNNVRKFLEMYLYFKYPDAKEDDGSKLQRFFGDDPVAASLTDRIDNEYSHLKGLFERGIVPVDVPAMKRMAEFVLAKMMDRDLDQYNSLLDSIGESPPEIGDAGNLAAQSG